MKAFSSGYGADSPFVKGAQAMEDLRKQVQDFVADAQQFGDLQVKMGRAITPEEVAQRVREAEEASQKMVLASISGVHELGAMESELQRLQGITSVAKTTLEQLGMSAEDAAKAVDNALNVSIGKLKDGYVTSLTSSISDLSGVGYLNDITGALKAYEARLADASQLGLDGSLAIRELSLSIKGIVEQSKLSKDEIAELSGAFPQLQFILSGISTTTLSLA